MAPVTETPFLLGKFIDEVQDRIEDNNANEIEEIVTSFLAETNRNSLILNVTLNGEIDERIFNVLVSSNKIKYLTIQEGVEVRSVEKMLRKAVQALPDLSRFVMKLELTESEARRIFNILRMNPSLYDIVVFLGECGEGIAKPLARFLRESSSVEFFSLSSWRKFARREDVTAPQAAVNTIFEGIGQSTSLKNFNVCSGPDDDDDLSTLAAGSLACAIETSTSLRRVSFHSANTGDFAVKVQKALMNTDAAKNFELCFRSYGEGRTYRSYLLQRDAPWKPLLSRDIPLALWPRILAKTNTWNRHVSHAPLDALFFLTKEKCDVLLQNVRRRKIRKRKRYQISQS